MDAADNVVQLASLVDMNSPEAVLEEVKRNFIHFYRFNDFDTVRGWYQDVARLYRGEYPGYLPCNTPFHDIRHVMEVLLAFSRLLDGYNIEHPRLPLNVVLNGLLCALLHDSGFIQSEQEADRHGTGARHTAQHVERSIAWIEAYIATQQPDIIDRDLVRRMIRSTDLQTTPSAAERDDSPQCVAGRLLGTADLLGQMSSRTYLEKLLFLYREFQEAGVPGYDTELDLLQKTRDFYDHRVLPRLREDLSGVYRYSRTHFRDRYGVDADLYSEAIERQLRYLETVLQETPESYRSRLRRSE